MAIDPKLVSIKQASDLPSAIPTNAGEFLFFEDNALHKSPMSDIYDILNNGINGAATESNAPNMGTGFFRYIVTEPITTGSAWGVEVTQTELDDNWVFFNVKDGVITKDSKPIQKGDSAYQVALDNGFVGTEAEWLSSLGANVLKEELSKSLYVFKDADLIAGTPYISGYIDNLGIATAHGTYRRTDYIYIKGQTALKYVTSDAAGIPSSTFTAFYDELKVFISAVGATASGGLIAVPDGAVYARSTLDNANTLRLEAQTNVDLISPKVAANNTLPIKNALAKDVYIFAGADLINTNKLFSGYIDNFGVAKANTNFSYSDYYYVKGQTKVRYVSSLGTKMEDNTYTAFYDSGLTFISAAGGITSGTLIDVPANAVFARTTIESYLNEVVIIEAQADSKIEKNGEKLFGKKIYCVGDSITAGSTSSAPYPTLLNSIGAVATNYGIPTTRMGGTETNAFVQRLPTYDTNSNYVIVMGGTNDYLHNIPMGVNTDTTNATFYGSLDVICRTLLGQFKNQKVAFMTPIKIATNAFGTENGGVNTLGKTLADYANAIKEVAAKYGIPCLDLNTKCGINPNIAENKALYFAADGCHPTTEGDAKMFNQIKTFIETL